MAASFKEYANQITQQDYTVIPRELLGDDIFNSLEQVQTDIVNKFKECGVDITNPRSVNKGPGVWKRYGLLPLHYLPSMVRLTMHPTIDHIVRSILIDMNEFSAEATETLWQYVEQCNITLRKEVQEQVGQSGLGAHMDCNPWNLAGPYDPQDNILTRAWPIDRPLQLFISLTDCPGGTKGGGLGIVPSFVSSGNLKRLQSMPPHGRHLRSFELTRFYPQPNLDRDWERNLTVPQLRQIDRMRDWVADAFIYPSYRKGDMVIWRTELPHKGAFSNHTDLQMRVYIGKILNTEKNRQYMIKQGQDLFSHSTENPNRVRADMDEAFDPTQFTQEQLAKIGYPSRSNGHE
eukprot:GILJ01003606.1.p1 GENE.GILJ01003606.1~~GILJ01003606.1.p1  ORF type:complete len:347 (+),score=35.57 GILJ01003606.1:72-1112(+)